MSQISNYTELSIWNPGKYFLEMKSNSEADKTLHVICLEELAHEDQSTK